MRKSIFGIAVIGMIFLASTPASAQLFICEKTFDDGTPVQPDNPQYPHLEYDNDVVNIIYPLVRVGLIGLAAFGILAGVYASIRDSFYAPGNDEDPAKYAKMRAQAIIAGLGIPFVILVLSWIVEWLTTYETTCMIPNFM